MFKEVLTKHNIRFQKKNRLKVLFYLPFLWLQEKIWHLKKRIRRVKKPVIHLYAVCWNEAKILPFMLDYYSQFVDHFYIYDNYSDDETDEILKSRENITVYKFDTGGTFNDLVHQKIKNTVWKKSRGKADWVIVIDTDEFIYHEHLIDKLDSDNGNVTLYKLVGYDMVSNIFPNHDTLLPRDINSGVESEWLSKCTLFNPNKIVEINYTAGAHNCNPEGIVIIENRTLMLLHYKYLSVKYVYDKILSYKKRMSNVNIDRGYATHYNVNIDEIKRHIDLLIKNSIKVI